MAPVLLYNLALFSALLIVFITELPPSSLPSKSLCDSGHSVDQRALKESPNIEYFLITQVTYKQCICVIHNSLTGFSRGLGTEEIQDI